MILIQINVEDNRKKIRQQNYVVLLDGDDDGGDGDAGLGEIG